MKVSMNSLHAVGIGLVKTELTLRRAFAMCPSPRWPGSKCGQLFGCRLE